MGYIYATPILCYACTHAYNPILLCHWMCVCTHIWVMPILDSQIVKAPALEKLFTLSSINLAQYIQNPPSSMAINTVQKKLRKDMFILLQVLLLIKEKNPNKSALWTLFSLLGKAMHKTKVQAPNFVICHKLNQQYNK